MSERNEWPLKRNMQGAGYHGDWWYYRDVPEIGSYGWQGQLH